ncbi:hypothetical protein K4H00_26820, partial [Mycobacterium tuberculosis]|nr:hypothetical protein [Mycobacterium tuberculosis]
AEDSAGAEDGEFGAQRRPLCSTGAAACARRRGEDGEEGRHAEDCDGPQRRSPPERCTEDRSRRHSGDEGQGRPGEDDA